MHSVVRFYRKIYDQEMSQVKMLHLDSNRIAKYFVIDGVEELGTAEYPKIPISDKAGEELSKLLALRSGEIELKYFLFCRFSSFISLNKYESKRLYPLIEFDATIEYSQEAWF
ncbi:MAG: hypothetical protein MI810_19070, partial [Flavobacteriales bacterium]|nr:hypothetical protein [Flavobacteriales bacterium]